MKKIKYTQEEWIKKIEEELPKDYQIGLHQIGVFGTEEAKKSVRRNNPITYLRKIKPEDYCQSIINNGFNSKWDFIDHTLMFFGSVGKITDPKSSYRRKQFLEYEYQEVEKSGKDLYDIIVAMPYQVSIDNQNYILGHLGHGEDMLDEELSAAKRVFYKSGVPKEFIYGYICKKNGTIEFVPNKKYIRELTPQEQEEFYKHFIEEKKLEPEKEMVKQSELKEKELEQEKEPLEAMREAMIDEQRKILSLIQESIDLKHKSLVPFERYSFLQRHITQRSKYKKYLESREQGLKENEKRVKKIKEINEALLKKGYGSSSSYKSLIETKIKSLKEADSFEKLGFENSEAGIKALLAKGIDFKVQSCQQAFELAPEYFGGNVEFMLRAIKENLEFLKYDRTDNEEVYKQAIKIKLENLRKITSPAHESIDREHQIKELEYDLEEIENPKQVSEGKYKVPHKFMFEEIRNKINDDQAHYFYSTVDGKYSKEFGEELEQLYENQEFMVGIHGRSENPEIEKRIFSEGLRNSQQNATTALNRTVAFGKDLSFVNLLDYRIPYDGSKSDVAIILTLPKKVFDKENPVPIWGSNSKDGDENYVLPQYIYGAYHGGTDGENRKILKNEQAKMNYRYLKYDYNSTRQGIVVENNAIEENNIR